MNSARTRWGRTSLQLRLHILIQGSLFIILFGTQLWVSHQVEKLILEGVKARAQEIANGVIRGLNILMVTKIGNEEAIHDKATREFFIQKMAASEKIKELRIFRDKQLDSEFPPGLPQEQPVDDIDRHVLATGLSEFKFNREGNGYGSLRTVVPFIASSNNRTIDCLICHSVSEGAVLGAASVTIDVTDDLSNLSKVDLLFWLVQGALQVILYFLIGTIVGRLSRQLGGDPNYVVDTIKHLNEGSVSEENVLQAEDSTNVLSAVKLIQEKRKQAENALENRLVEMETILQHVLVGIVYLKKRIIVSHNRGMEEIFGYEQGELLGKTTEMLYATHETFVEIGHRAYSDLPSVNRYSEEVKLKRKDGCVFWGLLTGRALDPTRAQEGSIWIYTDITDRKNVEEALAGNQERLRTTVEQLESSNAELKQSQGQLLQSEKMAAVGQLAAGVAHEINNPIGFVNSNLGTLKGYVEQLLALIDTYERCAVANGIEADATLQAARERADIAFLRDDVVALLGESRDGLERVKKIVQGLRDFSRIDSSDWQEADLIAGLESTLNVVSNELKYKADVVKNYGELPPVRCHLGQINQVFMNLLVNAAQAIEDRGKITLSSGAQGPWAWVSIEDTGKGMTPEVMKRIFEPFFTTKPVGKGTGLGLSLSYDMVKKHGGHIDVSSQPGLGTCIKVWLPVAGPENPLP